MLSKSEIYSHSSRIDPKDKLLSRYVESEKGCWNYTAGLDRCGYGRFAVGPRRLGAHKVSYVLHVGDVPEGMVVMHECDNPKCINPDHLSLGKVRDNVADCIEKGRFPFSDLAGARERRKNVQQRRMYIARNDHEMIAFSDIGAVRGAGFKPSSVYACCSGKRERHAGYEWTGIEREEHPPAAGG